MQSTLEKRRDKRGKRYCVSLSAEVARMQLANWPKAEIECGATKPGIKSADPMAPAVPRAPWVSPPAIPVAGSGLALFCSGVHVPKTG